jgi:glycine cleavage system H lipoate-binding protein
MTPLIDLLGTLGVFVVGLGLRLMAFVAIIALLSLPILLLLGGVEGLAAFRRRLLGVTRVGRMSWRQGLYYAPGHTWLAPARSRGLTVGLDDLAQRLLPSPARVTLPRVGAAVRRGEAVSTIRADGQETWIPSPVTGVVTAVNRAIARDPSLVHRDPYVRGWLFRVTPSDAGHEDLPKGEGARRWFVSETARFERAVEHELGFAAADGGELLFPVHALLEKGQWQRLTDSFLHAA